VIDEHEADALFDPIDRAARATEYATEAAIREQLRRVVRRVRALTIGGVPCCPGCAEPLPPHRKQAGICVRCLSDLEREEALRRG
jgi:RNA polymerase-binding transcription factor DksA